VSAGAVRALIVAGVSGSGKTTLAQALAARVGWAFEDGDDHHPSANVAKMARGEPLDDADRAPWLASLRAALDGHLAAGRGVVVACSALKRRYRDLLVGGRPDVAVVLLHAPEEVIAARLAARRGHFFDPRLLRSQLEALEWPADDEAVRVVDVRAEPEQLVIALTAALRGHGADGARR